MKGNNIDMHKGFTLIELLVVIAILGLLISVLLTTINPIAQFQKSNDARRKTDLETLQRALELYYQDNNAYPSSTSNEINGLSWGSAWAPYINKLPQDPVTGKNYVYFSTGQAYYLYTNLERGSKDPQSCNNGNACSGFSRAIVGFPQNTACGGTCNYGISSPNVSP